MHNVCVSNIVSVFLSLMYSQLAHIPVLLIGCYYFMTKNKIAMHCYCVTLCACLTSRVRFHSLEFLLIHAVVVLCFSVSFYKALNCSYW